MAKSEKLIPIIHKWEGGYSNHPNDSGGCTMKGITINTFKKYFGDEKTCSDLRNITNEQWIYVFEKGKLLEVGNHDQLIKKGKKYAQLWRAQNEKSSDIKAS